MVFTGLCAMAEQGEEFYEEPVWDPEHQRWEERYFGLDRPPSVESADSGVRHNVMLSRMTLILILESLSSDPTLHLMPSAMFQSQLK